MCGLIYSVLDNTLHFCATDFNLIPTRHYRDYTIDITCRSADWGIFIIYDDFCHTISHDFRFRAQYTLS